MLSSAPKSVVGKFRSKHKWTYKKVKVICQNLRIHQNQDIYLLNIEQIRVYNDAVHYTDFIDGALQDPSNEHDVTKPETISSNLTTVGGDIPGYHRPK